MRRRDFFALVLSLATWPLAAKAETRSPVIGILDPDVPHIFDAFVAGMRDLGYVEGQNVTYVRRSLQGKNDALPTIVAELAASKPDIIVTVAPY